MSVTGGFFNSINGDRRYNAEEMSAIFDGVINDGVFANIGSVFSVTEDTGFRINVGTGRAWFNSKWIYNDSILALTVSAPEVLLSRIDAVVIEVDNGETVRACSIKIVKGVPSSDPVPPRMAASDVVHQYPIAHILVEPGVASITQGKITNKVGTSDCPYITGILEVHNIDNIVAQWGAQWIEWFASQQSMGETEIQLMLEQWRGWLDTTKAEGDLEYSQWIGDMKVDFATWFESLQVLLDGDVASALSAKILDLEATFHTLEKHKAIYSELQDNNRESILDSNGYPIEAKSVFNGETTAVADDIGYSNDVSGLKAHTVQGALDELADRKTRIFHVTAKATDWVVNTNVLSVIGLPEDVTILLGLDDTATDDQYMMYSNALIRGVDQGLDSVTLKALGAIPYIDLPILILAISAVEEG